MKYISLVIFVLIIGISQLLVSASSDIPYQTHSSVQNELKEFIQYYLQEHVENLKDFKILNFHSEMVNENQIKVYFNYNFKVSDATTGVSRSELDGVAFLTKIQDKENEWSLDKIQIEDQQLEFEDPVIITPESIPQPTSEEPKAE